jgi:hypothetical protein
MFVNQPQPSWFWFVNFNEPEAVQSIQVDLIIQVVVNPLIFDSSLLF